MTKKKKIMKFHGNLEYGIREISVPNMTYILVEKKKEEKEKCLFML